MKVNNRYNFTKQSNNSGSSSQPRAGYNFSVTTPVQATQPRQPVNNRQPANNRQTTQHRTPFQRAVGTTARVFDNILHNATLGWFPKPKPAQSTGEKVADVVGTVAGLTIPVVGAKKTTGRLAIEGTRRILPKAGRVALEAAEGAAIGSTIAAAEGAIQGRPIGEIGQRALSAAAIGGATDAGVSLALRGAGKLFRNMARKAPDNVTQQTVNRQPAAAANLTTQPIQQPIQQTGQATGTAKRKEIVDFLSEKLNIPIRVGRYRAKRKGGTAIGIFKVKPEVIRTLQAEDLPVISHEVGHYLDKKLNLVDPQFDNELLALGKVTSGPNYTIKQIRGEGVAEFMNKYLTDPTQAKALAPKYYNAFETQIRQTAPETLDILHQARADIHNWYNQPSKARILGGISKEKGNPRKQSLDRLYTAAVDDLRPLQKAVEDITKGADIPITGDPARLEWLRRGWTGKANTFLHYGAVNEAFRKIGKSFDEIIRPFSTRLDDFRAYIVARRANELHGRRIVTGIAQADIDEVLKDLHNNEFDTAFRDLVDYQDRKSVV